MALNQQTINEIQKKASQGTALVTSTPEKMKVYNDYLTANKAPAPITKVPTTVTAPTVVTPQKSTSVYNDSANVKKFDDYGQQTNSVSGYQGATTPSFTASNSITDMVNNIRNQEGSMKQIWDSKDTTGSYNGAIAERNNLSGQLLDLITKESGGKASLGDIESILGRRLENQEMQKYRESFTGSGLEQSQLNNLWEHDFATRNNGEHYQYVSNFLNGGSGTPLGSSMTNYLNGMSETDRAQYGQDMISSLGSTQNYFNQRATGWTPDYVNNTANPLPYGAVDASDMINNGGKGMQQQYENYLWELQQKQQTPVTNAPTTGTQNPSSFDFNALMEMMKSSNGQTNYNNTMNQNAMSNYLGTNNGDKASNPDKPESIQESTNDDSLNRYLFSIFQGGA